jgi:SulP family sulfate permease
MPATGAIARTAVNVRAGGRTRLSAVVHAVVLLLVVLLAAEPVGHIPLAALAGVLMVTAIRMVHVRSAGAILRSTRADAIAYVATALVTVSVDLIVAVGIGVVVAGVFALRALARVTRIERETLPGDPRPGDEHIALLRVDGSLFFASADRILGEVVSIEQAAVVILRVSQLQEVDATGAHALTEMIHRLEARGITVLVKGVRVAHDPLFRRVGVVGALRHPNHLFDALDAAIEHARSHVQRAA